MEPAVQRVLGRSLGMLGRPGGAWGRGILLRGVIAATGATGTVRSALNLALSTPPRCLAHVNSGPIWLAALEAGVPDMRPLALGHAARLAGGPRWRGAISHLAWPPGAWSDTAFMACPLLARASLLAGRRDLAEEAVRQVAVHAGILARPDGLVAHVRGPWLFDGAAWARGNAWLLGAAVEVIEILGPAADALVPLARRLSVAIASRQDPGGLWPVLLDDPGSPLESSASALAARSFLALERLGLADPGIARAGLLAARAVLGCVDAGGRVGRSQGPTVWARITPVGGTWSWAQGLVLLMAAEISGP